MKLSRIVIGIAAVALVGCAGNQQAMERSLSQAEGVKTVADESKLDAALTANAAADLDSAKAYAEQGEEELAIAAADKSALEYKLAVLSAERDSLKKADARLESELRGDVERKLIYQSIVDQETKGAK